MVVLCAARAWRLSNYDVGQKKMKDTKKAHDHSAKQPSAVANYTFGPVSGLISGVNLNHHLPMNKHSGVLMTLYLYTVAGAAPALV
jgi:hypothetical protein